MLTFNLPGLQFKDSSKEEQFPRVFGRKLCQSCFKVPVSFLSNGNTINYITQYLSSRNFCSKESCNTTLQTLQTQQNACRHFRRHLLNLKFGPRVRNLISVFKMAALKHKNYRGSRRGPNTRARPPPSDCM